MGPHIKSKHVRNKLRSAEYFFLAVVCLIFVVVAGKYFFTPIADAVSITNLWEQGVSIFKSEPTTCASNQITVQLSDGTLCREKTAPSEWATIYDTYPLHPKGREIIYNFLDEGDTKIADQNLQNIFNVERSNPVKIFPITWEEDPYKDEYWKFVFYSLRPTADLLYAYRTTHDPLYKDKLVEIVQSFLSTGIQKDSVWVDSHAVAYRTMVLTNTWWKLREEKVLGIELSNTILQAIERHGEYLANEAHYEPDYNRGLNEAAALYELAVSFPTLPKSAEWLGLAKDRLNSGIGALVDSDGVLADNAPSYHFSVLEKAWDIYTYSQKFKQPIGEAYTKKLRDMIHYATYILQPDLRTPSLGASAARKISYADEYKEMAQIDSQLLYVLTQGARGEKPAQKNITFTEAGQAVLRSDWSRGADFKNQTQLIFDIGPYRTAHSDFDALSFNLYSNGLNLIPDGGPYNSDAGLFRNYFHGTASHNTVLVDGKSQNPGTAVAGQYSEGDGYVLQTAEQSLYAGVQHQRAIILIENKYILILDNLTSDKNHSYEQLFHLFPEATLTVNGLTANAVGKTEDQAITIKQILSKNIALSTSKGETNPIRGFCSKTYDEYYPCYGLSYKQSGTKAQFATLLEIGTKNPSVTTYIDGSTIRLALHNKEFIFDVSQTNFTAGSITVNKHEPAPILLDPAVPLGDKSTLQINPTNANVSGSASGTLKISSSENGKTVLITKKVALNLNDKNIYLNVRAENTNEIASMYIDFSNDNFASYMQNNLRNSYRKEYDTESIGISLGKGSLRDSDGQWQLQGNRSFDWGKIDAVRIRFSSVAGHISTMYIDEFGLTAGQQRPAIAFIFDDGYASIAPAIELMHQNNMPGNIAVIADRVDKNTALTGYLTLTNLKKYQDEYGWNMINHSQHHVDAVETYAQTKDLDSFEEDLLNGARFLIKNKLNSAPNWYVYPHGATNGQIKSVVSKYYTFARTTQTQPESYPFGENYGIKTLSAGGADSEGSLSSLSPENIINAIKDAQKYNITLLITFHRIHALPTDRAGYEFNDFKKIIEYMTSNGIQPKTLSQLDDIYEVPENTFTVTDEIPAQLSITSTVKNINIIERVKRLFD